MPTILNVCIGIITTCGEGLPLALEWFDSVDDEDPIDEEDTFYCPYTNAARCALLTKGWQPQELCLTLECEQVKLVHRRPQQQKRHKAA